MKPSSVMRPCVNSRGRRPRTPRSSTGRAPRPPPSTACESRSRAQRLRAELHVMRAPEVLLREVHLERRLQLLAVPGEAAQELLVVGAALVPVGEQRGGDVDALTVPALGDHVDLLAGDFGVLLP